MVYHLRELDNRSAIELLQLEYEYQVNYTNSETIAELVGNNPLSLHIAAKLVDDTHTDSMLIADLNGNLLRTLSSPDRLPESQNITYLLQLSYDRLQKETHVCGYYLSLFPGSFDQHAAIHILSKCSINDSDTCLRILMASSVLASYSSAGQPRFQYHRLIWEYFTYKRQGEGLYSHEGVVMFNTSFQVYFSDALYSRAISYIWRWP